MNSNGMKGDLVLQDINTGTRHILDHKEAMYKCGRATASHVVSQSILASREHCMFIRASGGLNVIDVGSSNGIFINGVRQQPRVMVALNINDFIGLGYSRTVPSDSPDPDGPTVYKLLLHEVEQAEPPADTTQDTGDVTTKIASENKRRQSRDSLESNVPHKVAKIDVRTSIPVIIGISDESDDEITVPTKTDNKSCDAKKIVEKRKKSPEDSKIGAPSNTKELSRSLHENNIEIDFITGTSTCSSLCTRKRSEDSEEDANPLNIEKPSTSSTPMRDRKISEDNNRNADPSSSEKVNDPNNTSRDRKRSADSDTSSGRAIADPKTGNSVKRQKGDKVENRRDKPSYVRELNGSQSPVITVETNSTKLENSKKERVQKEKMKSEVRLAVVKSSQLDEQVVPSRSGSERSSAYSEKTRNSKIKATNVSSKKIEEPAVDDLFVPAFDIDEFSLLERLNCKDHQRKSEESSANEPTIQRVNSSCIEQLIKYEPELNIVDNDESVYKSSINLTDVVAPTPIRLKRVKQEPKTRYSEFDVIVLSDNEDGVFPASQLFGDESDDEVERKVQIKDEEIEENDRDMFEDRRDDITDTIVLSDSDDEDNPWYDRLLRSQLLNESRLSLNSGTNEKGEAVDAAAPLDEVKQTEGARGAEEAEPKEEVKCAQEVEHTGVEKQTGLFEEEEQLGANAREIPYDQVEKEIYDLCFADEDNESKSKSVSDGPKRRGGKGKARRSTEKEKTAEETAAKVPLAKQCNTDSETVVEKARKNKRSMVNKVAKEKGTLEDRGSVEGKRTLRKKRSSEERISIDEKNVSTHKQLPELESAPLDKRLNHEDSGSTDKRLLGKKILCTDKRLSDEKSTFVDKSLPEQRILHAGERMLEVESAPSGKRLCDEKSVSVDKRSHEKKILSADERRLPDEKCVPTGRRLLGEKKLSVSKRLPEETRPPYVEKQPSIKKPSLPKQKSVEKTIEDEKLGTKDAGRHKPMKKQQDAENLQRRSNDVKSANALDIGNDKSDLAKPNRALISIDHRANESTDPVVILTKLDNSAGKGVQLVEAPFLVNGEGRAVSWNVTRTPATTTTGANTREKADPARKLTTKEKKELKLKSKIEEKMQLREQRHRRQRNKWAAECLPAKRKPAPPSLTNQERRDIASDRKERLKQIANEKRLTENLQPSPARRITNKAKAKVTMNSRNDFLVKELEEQVKLNSASSERTASEGGDKNSESAKRKDKALEVRPEAYRNEETISVHEEQCCSGEKSSPSGSADKGNGTAEGKIIQANGNSLSAGAKEEVNSTEVANESPVNDSINQYLDVHSVKPIAKKTMSSAILIDQSKISSKISEKSSKQTAIKALLIPNSLVHKFGESSRIVGQTLTSITNANESSRFVRDPRVTREFGNSRRSAIKENREPKEMNEAGQTKAKKRVSFNDLTTRVDFFEIEPGNSLKKCVSKDAPLMVKKLPKCSTIDTKACCPKLEQFLLHIFKWNPVWLEEQKQFNTPPPIVDEKKLVPLLSKYTNYRDYYNVLEPLMALELWYGITRDCEGKMNEKACFKFSIVNHSVVLTTIPSSNASVTTLMLEVVVSKRDVENQAHPVYGDLVFFQYISNRKTRQGCQMWKVFAYVTNVRQTVITPMTHFNRDLLAFVKDPHTLLTYTVMTKPLNGTDIQTNKVSRLRTISYLRSNIRMIQALQNLPMSPLCNTILNPKVEDYQLPPAGYLDSYPLVTKNKLNAKQLEAVARVTNAAVQKLAKVCLIQGPPGTGKSRVIVNLVTQILYGNGRYQGNKKMRILVCAPSNAAIDEIVLRLLEIRRTFQKGNRFNMVRIGRNESMHPLVKEVSVTELAIKDVRKTADNYMSPNFTNDSVEQEKRFLQARINALELEKSNESSHQDPLYRNQLDRKLGDIKAKYNLLTKRQPADKLDSRELARLQRAAENSLVKGADVIACTLSSCYTNHMETIFAGKDAISVCIVDEATQSAEAETLIPLMLGVRTLVLVGDTNQLPATVLSQKAKEFGLEQSLFARIQNAFDGQENNPIILLDTQYRMSYPVSYWPNRYFYGGAIKNEAEKYPFPFHCYKLINLDSTQDEDKFSNTEEASFVANLLYTMMTRSKLDHVSASVKIGVITPYNNQKQLIIKKIQERTAHVSEKVKKKFVHEVNTVDSFQGQERDIIVMSCVRSSGIGFLSDRQRLCVALTRAKHSLILCGNFRTFQRDSMWNALLTDARDRGAFVRVKSNAGIDEIKSHIIQQR